MGFCHHMTVACQSLKCPFIHQIPQRIFGLSFECKKAEMIFGTAGIRSIFPPFIERFEIETADVFLPRPCSHRVIEHRGFNLIRCLRPLRSKRSMILRGPTCFSDMQLAFNPERLYIILSRAILLLRQNQRTDHRTGNLSLAIKTFFAGRDTPLLRIVVSVVKWIGMQRDVIDCLNQLGQIGRMILWSQTTPRREIIGTRNPEILG